MKKSIYIINWEILKSGKVREFTTFDFEEYEEVKKNIINSNRYKLIEFYALELEYYNVLKKLEEK